jgi:hypothetical protein
MREKVSWTQKKPIFFHPIFEQKFSSRVRTGQKMMNAFTLPTTLHFKLIVFQAVAIQRAVLNFTPGPQG